LTTTKICGIIYIEVEINLLKKKGESDSEKKEKDRKSEYNRDSNKRISYFGGRNTAHSD
jgi:hypothetical protein